MIRIKPKALNMKVNDHILLNWPRKAKKTNSLNVIPTFQQTNAKQKSTTFRDSA
jgi:hypothetical protein